MNSYYNQNYSREDIANMVKLIQECIKCESYTVSRNANRQENIDFIYEYNLRSDKIKAILMNLTIDDFCHTVQNKKEGYEQEVLYVFVPQVGLFDANGESITVDIYIKINMIITPKGNRAVVISFHRRNKPIVYAFK